MPTIQMRDRILQTAITLFARHGFEDVPMMEIAFDAGIDEDKLREIFPEKLDIYEAIYRYIPELLTHYDPTREDIQELIEMGEGPREILERYVLVYDLAHEKQLRSLYRFAFIEQMRSRERGEAINDMIISKPAENAARTMDVLIERGLIPPCDSRLLADAWNRTSLMFERLTTLQRNLVNMEQYRGMCQFFIGLAVDGFTPVDVSGLMPIQLQRALPEELLTIRGEKLKIMLVAMDLFNQKGYGAVSMPEIAQKAKIPLSLLYNHYLNKSDILAEAMEIIHARREYGPNRVFSAALEMEPRAAVLHLAGAYMADRDELTMNLHRLLFREKYFSEDVRDYLIGAIFRDIEAITATLDSLVDQGRIEPCDSRRIATAFEFIMCSFSVGEAVFNGNYREYDRDRLKSIALILGMIEKKK